MLLRNTFSSTKKFFNKTFHSFRSLLTGAGGGGYQKLPKSSPSNNLSSGGVVHDLKTSHQSYRWEDSNHNRPIMNTNKENILLEKEPMKQDQEIYNEVPGFKNFSKQRNTSDGERREFVKQKLKEMVLMDLRNVDHVMDIEEVLYYYSHITCPVYVDIVDKFFMEMYSEFFIHQQTTSVSINNIPRRI